MRLDDFDYALPQELIAQAPPAQRGSSRLLHLDGKTGAFFDREFKDIVDLQRYPGDQGTAQGTEKNGWPG